MVRPIIDIGTYLLSTAQAEESVYNTLKVGMQLIDTADIYGNEVGVGRGIRRAMQDFGIKREEIFVTSKLWISSFNNADHIAEDYDIFDFELTPDEMQRINALECNHRFASY